MSELIEKETEEYRKGDPDPFDDRHPGQCMFINIPFCVYVGTPGFSYKLLAEICYTFNSCGWFSLLCVILLHFPGRANPECMLGHLLRILFKNDDFMNAVSVFVIPSCVGKEKFSFLCRFY